MQPEKPGCFPKHFNLGKIQEEKGVPFYHPNQSLFVWNQDFSFRSSCPKFAELSDITINWSFVCENMVRTNIFDFKVMSKSLGSERPCAVPIWAESLIPPEKLFACQRACRSLLYSWKDLLLVMHWKCNSVSDAGPNAHQSSLWRKLGWFLLKNASISIKSQYLVWIF